MCPKHFSWAKNKRKLFSDGKSRGPLLAGAALNGLFQTKPLGISEGNRVRSAIISFYSMNFYS